MPELSTLVRSAKQRNQEAFVTLVKPLEKQVYHLLFSVLGNWHDAEDAWQETVVKAWLHIYRLRSPHGFKAWFCRIALNEAQNILRKRARQPMLLESWPEPAQVEHEAVERYLAVHSSLAKLSLEQRTAVVLRFWLDMTIKDLAVAMHVPLSAAKSRLYAGMEQIKQMVGKEAEDNANSFD